MFKIYIPIIKIRQPINLNSISNTLHVKSEYFAIEFSHKIFMSKKEIRPSLESITTVYDMAVDLEIYAD